MEWRDIILSYNLRMGNKASVATTEVEKDEYDIALDRANFRPLLENPEILSARQKKWRRFSQTMIQAKSKAINGAMMGGMVGGMFGLLVGIYSAVQTRRLLSIPISILVSGGTFGFIMGCGSMIRNDSQIPQEYSPHNYWTVAYAHNRRRYQPE